MFELDQPQNHTIDTHISRRRFLQLGIGATATLAMPNAFASLLSQPERKIALLNLHTGESLNATYWAEGQYQISELHAISRLLRDHRTGDIHAMDNSLIDILNMLHQQTDGKKPFHVISGYRSPKTNALLNKTTTGVAKKSLHMQGKAIDIRLPGRKLSDLRNAALDLHLGGVGYYSSSDFIHLDTGRVRQWGA